MGWNSNPEWRDYKQAIYESMKEEEIVDISIRSGFAFVASKHWKHGYVYATVARLSKVDGVIAVKLMDEWENPEYYNPPKRLMSKLTPLDEIEAIIGRPQPHRGWRENVQAYLDGPRPRTLLPGDCVRFSEAISFNDGSSESEFKIVKLNRRTLFKGRTDGELCNVRGYKDLEYVVLGGDERW